LLSTRSAYDQRMAVARFRKVAYLSLTRPLTSIPHFAFRPSTSQMLSTVQIVQDLSGFKALQFPSPRAADVPPSWPGTPAAPHNMPLPTSTRGRGHDTREYALVLLWFSHRLLSVLSGLFSLPSETPTISKSPRTRRIPLSRLLIRSSQLLPPVFSSCRPT